MTVKVSIQNIGKFDELMGPMLRAARIPGAAIAVVAGAETIFAKGFGYRDLEARLPMTADTIYPIASTAKAFNATLLGMLVDEGRLAWDVPVQNYLPRFGLQDRAISPRVTLRDLVAMRTGLPGHEFVWVENPIDRAELVEHMRHLPLSASWRERFQYSDLTATVAGHVAEIVTGQSWEELIGRRIFEPLRMSNTGFTVPTTGNVTLAYHENSGRRLFLTPRVTADLIAPAGGSIHSTMNDMVNWLIYNLNSGHFAGRQLIEPTTLKHIHSPCVVMGADPAAPSPNASYGLGWFVDTYNGRVRVSHTGHLYDVNSCVTLFPEEGLGMVSFINFASARLAALINQHAFDLIMGFEPVETFEQALQLYEKKIANTQRRNAGVRRIEHTAPSHPLNDYVGSFLHAGYGRIEIRRQGEILSFERGDLVLPLEHWHYDTWVAAENDLFEIHKPHLCDRATPLLFHTNAQGEIAGVSIQLEPAVAPIHFRKQTELG